jgi:integrase
MPRKAEGAQWPNADGTYSARITVQGARRTLRMSAHIRSEEAAAERRIVLAQQAQRMAHTDLIAASNALECIAMANTAPKLAAAIAFVDKLVDGWKPAAPVMTVRALGKLWTDGDLAKRHKDHVRARSGTGGEVGRLEKHVYPHIGDLPLDAVTLDACDIVAQQLPDMLKQNTRVNILSTLAQLLGMAVFPCRLIERSPLPKGWVPKRGESRAHGYLYADEDLRLMRCTQIPLRWRVLWGWLIRQGQRDSEVFRMKISDLDLAHCAVVLDKNKTRRPRTWAIEAGDAAGMKRYLELCRPNAEPSDYLFVDDDGRPITTVDRPAEMLREHLHAIGLDKERPYLFEETDERLAFRAHDLRGTFITLSLAAGRSEAWVQQRTGHRSSRMINLYAVTARTVAEAHSEPLRTLIEAVPELAPPPATGLPSGGKSQRKASGFGNPAEVQASATTWHIPATESQPTDITEHSMVSHEPTLANHVQPDAVGDSLAFPPAVDPVEKALADALTAASAAGQWHVVADLARELEARRLRATAPSAAVVSLSDVRRRREPKR